MGTELTIIFVPFAAHEVLCISRIMTSPETTVMVIHGEKIIDQTLPWLRVFNPAVHIQTFHREVHKNIQLVAEPAAGTESFQVHNENIRRLPEFKFLTGTAMLFATRTVPRIIFGQNLFLVKLVKTFVECHTLLLSCLAKSTTLGQLWIRDVFDICPCGRSAKRVLFFGVSAKESIMGLVVPIQYNTLTRADQRACTISLGLRSARAVVIREDIRITIRSADRASFLFRLITALTLVRIGSFGFLFGLLVCQQSI